MITSLYSFVENHIDNGSIRNLKSHIEQVGAWSHFELIYLDYGVDWERVATYLILTYSQESTFVVSGVNWRDVKLGIADLCKVDTDKYEDVIYLKSDAVKKAVTYLLTELKGWKYKILISLREASENLNKLAMEKPDSKQKNSAKNIRDASLYAIELSKKADEIVGELLQTTKNGERLTEVMDLYKDASMEKLLRKVLDKK